MSKKKRAATGDIFCTAFKGNQRIAGGELSSVLRKTKPARGADGHTPIQIFNDLTGAFIEVDARETVDQLKDRLAKNTPPTLAVSKTSRERGPGRPKLGVIAREVTLLPGHWDWLDAQPSGASAALRRLVHEAKNGGEAENRARQSQEAVYKFMTVMAGDLPGFEEALRAFYRRDHAGFNALIKSWPKDIRSHIQKLAEVKI